MKSTQTIENQHKYNILHKYLFYSTVAIFESMPSTSLLYGFYVPSLRRLYHIENQYLIIEALTIIHFSDNQHLAKFILSNQPFYVLRDKIFFF